MSSIVNIGFCVGVGVGVNVGNEFGFPTGGDVNHCRRAKCFE